MVRPLIFVILHWLASNETEIDEMTIMEVFFITEVNSDVEFVPGSDVLISHVNEEENIMR